MSKDAVTTATERNHLAKKWTSGLTTKQDKQKTNHLETTIDTGGDKQASIDVIPQCDRNFEVHTFLFYKAKLSLFRIDLVKKKSFIKNQSVCCIKLCNRLIYNK